MTDSVDPAKALANEWDQRYDSLVSRLPDMEPNAVLLAEAENANPGRALDIGCGAGAEAVWLATRGWDVTALDVSRVALDHAARRARQAGVEVRWIPARLEDAQLASPGFDLVTAFYPALLHTKTDDASHALLSAVAADGVLVVVHHADVDTDLAKSHGFDPADYLSHQELVELLADGWDVRVEGRRPRVTPAGSEGQHTHDDVVVARRRR